MWLGGFFVLLNFFFLFSFFFLNYLARFSRPSYGSGARRTSAAPKEIQETITKEEVKPVSSSRPLDRSKFSHLLFLNIFIYFFFYVQLVTVLIFVVQQQLKNHQMKMKMKMKIHQMKEVFRQQLHVHYVHVQHLIYVVEVVK